VTSRNCKTIREEIDTEPKIGKWFQDLAAGGKSKF
jgi:hypothetical protein